MLDGSDEIRLRHMLDSAKEAVSLAEGRMRAGLEGDRRTVLAVVKDIEMIGEAASKVSEQCRRGLSEVPWAEIVAMRNRLVHAYFDIDLDRVWETVTDDLPPLIARLEDALPPGSEDR